MKLIGMLLTLLTYFTSLAKAEDPVLVILGGTDNDDSILDTSLVVGLQNDYECNIGELAHRTYGAVGGISGSQMIYCGGSLGNFEIQDNCYYYDPDYNIWSETDHEHGMNVSRHWAGYARTDHGLMATGGYEDEYICAGNTAEYLSKANGKWEYLPKVPLYSRGSCLVQLNHSHTLHIGGAAATRCCIMCVRETNTVLAFNWITKEWSEMEPMKENRTVAMCAQLNDGKIIVTGGQDLFGLLKSTEIFDPVTQSWTSGPDLPLYWGYGKLVSYSGGPLLVNGFTKTESLDQEEAEDTILQFKNNEWIEFPKKLPYPRANAVVFVADGDSFAKNCNVTRNSSSKSQTLLSLILFCLALLLTK